jgi:hypothetical protein
MRATLARLSVVEGNAPIALLGFRHDALELFEHGG